MTSTESACSICAEPLEPHTRTECTWCGNLFHLNQRTDLPGKDCGTVGLGEESFGLEFTCETCSMPEPEISALDDILTLEEAARFIEMSEEVLAEAAEKGRIRHRKAGPVYLFEKADIIGFRPGPDLR